MLATTLIVAALIGSPFMPRAVVPVNSPTIALTLIFLLGLMFNPFPMFYRTPRFEIVKVLWEILISPFGLVKFRHFFLADVITSARLMLSDSTAMVCFYSSGDFRASAPIKCSW